MTRPAPGRALAQPETPPEPSRPELLALALVAASVIVFEIVLTRIFSFITRHHYTPLIIGIALLGFGFAGSYLSARGGAAGDRATFLAHLTRETLAYAVALPLALLLVSQVRFDPSRIFADWTPALWLAVYLAAVVVPFGAAGLVICRLIDRYRARAGRVYGTDLAASAAGVLAGLGLLGAAGAEAAALAAAFLAAVAATLLASAGGGHRRLARATTAVLGALAVAAAIAPPGLFRPPPSKEMAAFESEPALRQVRFEVSRWHPLARIDVTADMRGPAFESVPILRGYLQSAPYKIRPRARALVIGFGSGIDLAIALAHGSTAVTGVEVNPVTFGLLGRTFLDYGGGPSPAARASSS